MTYDAAGSVRGDAGKCVEWMVGDVVGDESEDRADVSSANVGIHGKGETHDGSVDEEGRNVASLRLKSIIGVKVIKGVEGASSTMSLFAST